MGKRDSHELNKIGKLINNLWKSYISMMAEHYEQQIIKTPNLKNKLKCKIN
uniref:Uncharacterized protein n=1 Tax=Solanum lycopersicum TaxID=4081 RepID=A0A3Q7JL61_SOLLC